MPFGDAKYLLTDPDSKLMLEKGKLFVADFQFEKGPLAEDFEALISDFEANFISMIQSAGHDISVVATMPVFGIFEETVIQSTAPSDIILGGSDFDLPTTLIVPEEAVTFPVRRVIGVRVYFRVFSVIATIIVAALAAALITAFIGIFLVKPLVPVFIGIAAASENVADAVSDVAQTIVKQPAKLIEAVGRNPWPIIAIVVAISFFIFGITLKIPVKT